MGAEFAYRVERGDTLAAIGARFAVSRQTLAARNRLSVSKRLVAGRTLRIDNRHIVPQVLDDGILINVPQRILYLFEDGPGLSGTTVPDRIRASVAAIGR